MEHNGAEALVKGLDGAAIEPASASSSSKSPRRAQRSQSTRVGRSVKRMLSSPDIDPFDAVTWERRTCSITNDTGGVVFEQQNVEVPSNWSQMAASVVASKYLHGAPGSPERETGVRALVSRVVNTITAWGTRDGYFSASSDAAIFRDELSHLMLHQMAAFNSPVWFNVGVQERPQCSACFILSVDDTLDSLLNLQTLESRIFKYGSGTGSNFSKVRSSRERLSGGGVPSGPLSFMRAFDSWAGIIKSGGKTRRAAKMLILNSDHPDIMDFITAKSSEERKAWALIESGYDGGFAIRGGAYDSVGFQNANLSVRVTDDFMQAAVSDREWSTRLVKSGEPCERLRARDVLRAIADATHLCGDPGLQFDTTINRWHTVPRSGRINSSNPCSEYMSLDDSACNLSSINLLKFYGDDGAFAVEAFEHAVDIMLTAQEILIDNSSYPSDAIQRCAHDFRQLGLGYTNLGALLLRQGLPYDSDEGRAWAAAITSLMTGASYRTSALLAKARGPFAGYQQNVREMDQVIAMHQAAADGIPDQAIPPALARRARTVWGEARALGAEWGYRNSQTTVLAPTGTISFMMDCDTTGIEPELALIKYKKLSDGGMLRMVNHSVSEALRRLGYADAAVKEITAHVEKEGSVEGAPHLKTEHLPVFDCALKPAKGSRVISYHGHLAMMAAVQPFLSGAISKTVNLPSETTPEEIYNTYVEAWRMGIKAVALYRDGSKRTQPLNVSKEGTKAAGTGEVGNAVDAAPGPVRRRLPDERPAITHRFSVGGMEGYLTVGLFDDARPGEIFLVVAKEGSTLSGLMDAFATSVSLALQYGVPIKALVRKFSHLRFEPAGFTGNPEIPVAKSIIDYVFRWLGSKFLTKSEQREIGLLATPESSTSAVTHGTNATVISDDAPPCSGCGSALMVRQGSCYVCLNCGSQGGCG